MTEYQGIDSLENLKEAVNYNGFLERELVNFIGNSKTILDFGAGNGEFAQRLKAKGLNVNCVELSPTLQAHLRAEGFTVEDSLNNYGSFEKIYSLNVLEHIEDDTAELRNLHKHLEADGKLFIYVPAFMALYSDFDKKIGHFRRYTKTELVMKLRDAGFVIERAEYADSGGYFAWFALKLCGKGNGEPNRRLIKIYDTWLFPISRIMDVFLKKLFGKNLLVIARKI